MIRKLLNLLVRKKASVNFNDLERVVPVSTLFGFDRGTPIDRHYIGEFIAKNADLISGHVLEVGECYYARRYGAEKLIRCDVLHRTPDNPSATLVGDLTDADTLPESMYDCFICTQTFNFIFDVNGAVAGAHRLLKPGGVLLATMAGISQISRYDIDRWGDYWRFTTLSAKRLFTAVFGADVEIRCFGNSLAACAFLQGLAVEDLPNPFLLQENDPDYQLVISVVARKAF